MIKKVREKFTKWYVKRGYTFGYRTVPIYDDGFLKLPSMTGDEYWHCPWYVRPLLIFFSPSVYMIEKAAKIIVEGYLQGLNSVIKEKGE